MTAPSCRGTTGPPRSRPTCGRFRVLVRNALFHRVRLAALGQYEELGALDSESGWGRLGLGGGTWRAT